ALTEELSADLTRLDNKRGQLTSAVEADLLVRYSKLKQSRKDLALAPVRNGICFGCRLQLPPQLVAEVKRSEVLHACTYCQRILYWEGELPSATVPANTQEEKVSSDAWIP